MVVKLKFNVLDKSDSFLDILDSFWIIWIIRKSKIGMHIFANLDKFQIILGFS